MRFKTYPTGKAHSLGAPPSYREMGITKPQNNNWNKPNSPSPEIAITCCKCHQPTGTLVTYFPDKNDKQQYIHDGCMEKK